MLKIIEIYDGRLPEYQVVEVQGLDQKILKVFETHEEASRWCDMQLTSPCGEERPDIAQ